jgi:hypothetical protein
LLLSAAPVFAQVVADAGITTDLTDIPEAGVPVEFTAHATDPNTIYYRFYYKARYGTMPNGWGGPDEDPPNPWIIARDWSTNNVASIIFPSEDNYIVVVQTQEDRTRRWEFGDPQEGMSVYVGNPLDLQLSSITLSSVSGIPTAGEPIMVEANSVDLVVVYYRFLYKAGYGTLAYYAPGGWMLAQDWSTSNSATITFPTEGNYMVVVQAREDSGDVWEFGDPQGGFSIKVEP